MSLPDIQHAAPQTGNFNADPHSSSLLLTTKLYAPRPHADSVPRPRLYAQLGRAFEVPLTVVAAPAGFGKTTLVVQWLHAASQPVAWLSLDTSDNDPAIFLHYLVRALQRVAPNVGVTLLALLNAPQPPRPEALITLLINDLAALKKPVMLVLDDYHVLDSPPIHEMVRLLIERLPPQAHMILTTREDPPLPLARLRSRRQLVEIRDSALRFTDSEAEMFLREVMGLTMTAEQVAALEARTEGWIAGLHLVALALQERRDVADFVAHFTGSHRFIVEYLMEEVLGALPQHLRSFVLHISILERFCAPLCDALVLGRASHTPYSQLLIDQISSMNLFVIPLDDEQRWYRFHHLFRDMLHHRLQTGVSTREWQQLHRSASHWFEHENLIVEAIHHGLLAEDWEHVINLITQHGMDLVLLGRVQTVLGWLRELPKHTLHASFAISLVYGSALLFTNQFARAEDYLAEAQRLVEQQPNTAHNSYLLAQVLAMRASTPILSGDVALCDYYARQSLALLSPSQSVWYAGILTLVCNGYLLSGDVGSAWEELAAYAIAAAQPCNNRLALLHSIVSLARIHHLQGRLRQAMLTYQEMLQWVTGWDELVGIVSGPAYFFGLGNVLREQNQFDAAEQLFDRGVAAIAAMGVADAEFLLRGYIALAQLKQAQGQTEAASAVLNAFATLMHERAYHPSLVENLEAARARIALLDGQIAVAAAWANNANISPDDPINFLREDIYLTLIRVRIAQNALESIFPLLDRLLSDAETKARGNSIIEILVLRALAFHRSSNIDHAMQELTRALAFAEPEGYVRTFVDEGAPMVALLQEARARGVQPDYCERLLNAFPHLSYTAPPTKLAAAQSPVPGADLVEVLNERELEILRLIALGHSNREIADHLMVALSTVKWHINNMYGKLNVSTRTQALVRAGELGLL